MKKSMISSLALSAAVFFSTSLLAKPPAQNYPEYPQNEGALTATTTTRTVTSAPKTTTTSTASTKSTAVATTTKTETTYTAATTTKSERVVATSAIGQRFDSNLYTVEKTLLSAPGEVGAEYSYRLRVTALADITDVRITENLPDGLALVRTEPDASASGSTLNWSHPSMYKGQVEDKIITVRATREGEFLTTSKVCIDPVVVLPMRAGTPRLAVEKTGPAFAELNSQAAFQITVRNVGTAPARDVVVVDQLPNGLSASSGNPTFQVGTLAPGESKTFTVPTTASAKGDYVNRALVTSSNAAQVAAESPISVKQSRLDVAKSGPDRLFIFKNATYNITVTNSGDTTLENVVVTDDLPKGTSLVSASGSTTSQSKDRVVWNIASLAPGQSLSDSVTLTSTEPGTTTNRVTARASNGISETASATTVWEGPPGVLTEIVDNVDPVRVGDQVIYTVRITNQGTHREINSQVKVIFGDEVTPMECSDRTASINGKEVSLPDVIIKPRGVTTFTIKAKAVQAGVSTTRLEFNSSFLPRPINKDETTFVY